MELHDVALTMNPDIDSRTIIHLLEHFQSAEELFSTPAAEIVSRAGLNEDIAARLVRKEYHKQAEEEMDFARRNKIRIITAGSGEYPRKLEECCDRPHVIYVKGGIDLNSSLWLSIVGTRKMTSYGRRVCEDMVKELAVMFPEMVVVSGLAFGIDVTAQIAALNSGLKTISVLGHPMTHIYPSQHTSVARKIVDCEGALISEYHSRHITHKNDFVERNRIVAGLSDGVIVVESPDRGGSLYTADMADGYNRMVMAVPGRTSDRCSEGTNRLIKSLKGHMVCGARDVANVLGWEADETIDQETESTHNVAVESPGGRILGLLNNDTPIHIEELISRSGMEMPELSSVLFDLEMKDLVRNLPGKLYIKE